MKNIMALFACFIFIASAIGQLKNTRWKSTVIIDNPVNVILDFKQNTVDCYRVADNSMIESMSYSLTDSTFTLTKISGQSDCDNSVPGKYSYKLLDGKMTVKLMEDACTDRSSVLDNTEWSSWHEPVAVEVSEEILRDYVGIYEMDRGHPIRISLDREILYAEGPNNNLPKSPLIPVGTGKFFLRVAGADIEFVKNDQGKVLTMNSHIGKDYVFKKIK
jgi:hypothetical protein